MIAALLGALSGCAPRSHWALRSGVGVVLAADAHADGWVTRARDARLAQRPGWLKLGHYRRDPLGTSYRSDADGPEFFLSPDGRFDPSAELEATLRAVLAPVDGTSDAALDAHPACRFPGRVLFLARELGLDLSRLGVTRCPKYQKYLEELRPEGVTLVFTSYYLNNPASAFGHTFLRVRKANTYAAGEKRELLDYGIDFSADVTSTNPLAYAVMGMTGMFRGTFKRMPYYFKVREYNDTESRDLWEYDLALDPYQGALLVAHIWEVGATYFDYYYIGENCAYAILSLLDAARPELDLMADISSPVIPAATVQALFDRPGLVGDVRYRPALRTQLAERARDLSSAELDLVERVEQHPELALPLSDARALRVLDAALDLLDVRNAHALIHDRAHSEAAERKQVLLTRRASIRLPSPPLEVEKPDDEAPQFGHGARRIGLGAGVSAAGKPFASVQARLALHELVDPPRGYPETAQIEFLPTHVRFGESSAGDFRLQLERIDLVHVLSLSSIERFERNISFQMAAGAIGLPAARGRLLPTGRLLLGGGVAKSLLRGALTVWSMGDAEVLIGRAFSRELEDLPLRVGAGLSGGVRVRLHADLVLVSRGFYYFYPFQAPDRRYEASAALLYQFARDFAIGLEGRVHAQGFEGHGAMLSYF